MWRERAALLAVGGFAAATIIDLVIALHWVGLGNEPGDSTVLEDIAGALAFPAFILGFVVSFRPPQTLALALLPLAAAGWMTVHYYTFDPYFYPSDTRFSEGGSVAAWRLYLVALAGLALVLVIRRWPRAARAVPIYLLLCFLTTVAQGIGH